MTVPQLGTHIARFGQEILTKKCASCQETLTKTFLSLSRNNYKQGTASEK
jgi:hypothetical protein